VNTPSVPVELWRRNTAALFVVDLADPVVVVVVVVREVGGKTVDVVARELAVAVTVVVPRTVVVDGVCPGMSRLSTMLGVAEVWTVVCVDNCSWSI